MLHGKRTNLRTTRSASYFLEKDEKEVSLYISIRSMPVSQFISYRFRFWNNFSIFLSSVFQPSITWKDILEIRRNYITIQSLVASNYFPGKNRKSVIQMTTKLNCVLRHFKAIWKFWKGQIDAYMLPQDPVWVLVVFSSFYCYL